LLLDIPLKDAGYKTVGQKSDIMAGYGDSLQNRF